jgi:hypothetical protein
MATRRFVINVLTDGAGAATVYSPYVSGKLCAIHYTKTDFATGVDFTITAEATGQTLWAQNDVDASTVVMPRSATHSTAGVAALYAAAGTAVGDLIRLGRDRIKFVIAAGGPAHTGQFQIVMED